MSKEKKLKTYTDFKKLIPASKSVKLNAGFIELAKIEFRKDHHLNETVFITNELAVNHILGKFFND